MPITNGNATVQIPQAGEGRFIVRVRMVAPNDPARQLLIAGMAIVLATGVALFVNGYLVA